MSRYDLIIQNVSVVRPSAADVQAADIAIKDGRIAALEPGLDPNQAKEVFDGKGQLAFPGLVDAHMHCGIYAPLHEDAYSESQAAAMGGVTASLNYMRTGKYYLNRGGPYHEFFPEVLRISEDRFFVDYAYHLAPISGSQIDEMGDLIDRFGVSSFKIFMFYGSHGLHGKASDQKDFLMIGEDERYDFAHFEFIMRELNKVAEARPALAEHISLSLHCETAEIMRAYTQIVEREGKLTGLAAYSASRPQHSEGLAIFIASYLAHETSCANINLLHLSSRKAVEAAMMMAHAFPHINFRREVTVGHLLLDIDSPNGCLAKVNPPIRPREDVEYLWDALLRGDIDWVVSDHACCKHEVKVDSENPDAIFLAKSGFGGTEYLLSGLHTEGRKRGLSLNRMAELLCWNPAQRYGLLSKGDLAPGFDADVVLFDPNDSFVVKAEGSPSTQGYTPFEGMSLDGRVKTTFLRGQRIFDDNQVIGVPKGQYIHRPTSVNDRD